MFTALRNTGLWLNSLRGFVWAILLMPSVVILIGRWMRGLDWSETIFLFMGALAFGVIIAFFGLKLFEYLGSRFTGSAERKRIREQIESLKAAGYPSIDTPTIAAIWAGTMEAENIERHVKFRLIKAAVDTRQINGAILHGPGGANKNTQIPIAALELFFEKNGVIDVKH
jgi:hypothetical protein